MCSLSWTICTLKVVPSSTNSYCRHQVLLANHREEGSGFNLLCGNIGLLTIYTSCEQFSSKHEIIFFLSERSLMIILIIIEFNKSRLCPLHPLAKGYACLFIFSPTRPSGPSWSVSRDVCIFICPLPMRFFSRHLIGPQIT